MLSELFKALFITSLAGSALTLVIALTKPVTKKIFGYKWHYYIWLAVLFVMILPIRLSMPEKNTEPVPIVNEATAQSLSASETIIYNTVQNNPTELVAVTSQASEKNDVKIPIQLEENRINILGKIWLIGTLLMLSVNIFGYLRLIYKVRKKSVVTACPEIKKYTKRKITVRTCRDLSSPFIMGVFRPSLILPDIELTEMQLDNILMHETTHLKRNDLLLKWFAAFVKALHWFNPISYYIAKQINKECEISCDLAITKDMNNAGKLEYVNTILSLLAANKTKSIPLTTGMTGNKKMLKRRFIMIKNTKTTRKITSALSVLIALALLGTTVFASGILAGMAEPAEEKSGRIEITFDGEVIDLENKPFIKNGDIYFPLRETLEKIGVMDNPESAIIWNDGKIDVTIAVSEDIVNPEKAPDEDITTLLYYYALEIGKAEIIVNTHPNLAGQDVSYVKQLNNAPILVDGITYIPYNDLSWIMNDGVMGNARRGLGYTVYDKNGEMSEYVGQKRSSAAVITPLTPTEVVNNFFAYFAISDFENMKNYCTDECIDLFFGDGFVFGMVKAEMTAFKVPVKYEDSSTDRVIGVKVNMVPCENSVYMPDDTETGFNVYLVKQADGRYLINEFGR